MGTGPDQQQRTYIQTDDRSVGEMPTAGESRFFWFVFFAALQRK
jgi:hypothetical protein